MRKLSETPCEHLPDFLILGAPKAGSTALYAAVARHPEVFACSVKEPRYLAFPEGPPDWCGPGDAEFARTFIDGESAYRKLFRGAPAGSVKFEASVVYLWSDRAPAQAAALVPHARLIAMLRQPVERAFSQWLHQRRDLHEPLADFEAAWDAEEERKRAGWSYLWRYRERGFYAQQLRRWLEGFPREQVLVLFYEDWLAQPQVVLDRIWRHIGVAPLPGGVAVGRENTSTTPPQSRRLHQLLHHDNPLRRWAQRCIPASWRRAVVQATDQANREPKPVLTAERRRRLTRVYFDDLADLEVLTGRDLSAWRA